MPTTTYDLDDDVLLLVFSSLNRYLGDILHASRVNQRWRRLIIFTGGLWNEIYRGWVVHVPIPLQEALDRSQIARLELVGEYKRLGPTALSTRNRLRIIRVYINPVEDFTRWVEVVRGGVPHLEHMRLIFKSYFRRSEADPSYNSNWATLNEINLPSLREFTHHRVVVPFDLLDLPKLMTTNVTINDFSHDMGVLFEKFPLLRDVRLMPENADPNPVITDRVEMILRRMAQLEYLELKAEYLHGDVARLSIRMLRLPIPSVTLSSWRADNEADQARGWIDAARQAIGSAAPWRAIISREDLDRVGHTMSLFRSVSEPVTVTVEAISTPGLRRKVRARAQREISAGIRAALCAPETQTAVVFGRVAYQQFCFAFRRTARDQVAIEELTLILSRHDKDNLSDILSCPGRIYLPQLQRLLIRSRPFELLDMTTIELGELLAERIVTPPAGRVQVRFSGVELYGHSWHIPPHADMNEEIRPWTFVRNAPVGTLFQLEAAELNQVEFALHTVF